MKNSINRCIRTLKGTCILGRQTSHNMVLGAQGERRNIHYIAAKSCLLYIIALSRTYAVAYNTAFAHLTEEEIAVDV